jgi:hypothetical protein
MEKKIIKDLLKRVEELERKVNTWQNNQPINWPIQQPNTQWFWPKCARCGSTVVGQHFC